MSNAGLFALGTVVTLLVAASLSLLVWGAILDGRYEHEQQGADGDAPEPLRRDHAPRIVDAA